VQPRCAADPQAPGGGIDAGKHLRIEAQADRGRAWVGVPRRGHVVYGNRWLSVGLGTARFFNLRGAVLNDGDGERRKENYDHDRHCISRHVWAPHALREVEKAPRGRFHFYGALFAASRELRLVSASNAGSKAQRGFGGRWRRSRWALAHGSS
jgi:hypothetical protein